MTTNGTYWNAINRKRNGPRKLSVVAASIPRRHTLRRFAGRFRGRSSSTYRETRPITGYRAISGRSARTAASMRAFGSAPKAMSRSASVTSFSYWPKCGDGGRGSPHCTSSSTKRLSG